MSEETQIPVSLKVSQSLLELIDKAVEEDLEMQSRSHWFRVASIKLLKAKGKIPKEEVEP